jgi:hypothetical protein
MSAANSLTALEACRRRFDRAVANESRLACVMTRKNAYDSAELKLPSHMCGMSLASVKTCSLSPSALEEFAMYFFPRGDHPPGYSPHESFSAIAKGAAACLLSLPSEAHSLIWGIRWGTWVPTNADPCTLWLCAVFDLATSRRFLSLKTDVWPWPDNDRGYKAPRQPLYMAPEALPYRLGAILDDVLWASAEACRIVQTLPLSLLSVSEIHILRDLVSRAQTFPLCVEDAVAPAVMDEATFQSALARLRKLGLVESREGKRNLMWVTPKGFRIALGLND